MNQEYDERMLYKHMLSLGLTPKDASEYEDVVHARQSRMFKYRWNINRLKVRALIMRLEANPWSKIK